MSDALGPSATNVDVGSAGAVSDPAVGTSDDEAEHPESATSRSAPVAAGNLLMTGPLSSPLRPRSQDGRGASTDARELLGQREVDHARAADAGARHDGAGVLGDHLADDGRPRGVGVRAHEGEHAVGVLASDERDESTLVGDERGSSPRKPQAARTSSATGTSRSTMRTPTRALPANSLRVPATPPRVVSRSMCRSSPASTSEATSRCSAAVSETISLPNSSPSRTESTATPC
jgi:hypothetical protein